MNTESTTTRDIQEKKKKTNHNDQDNEKQQSHKNNIQSYSFDESEEESCEISQHNMKKCDDMIEKYIVKEENDKEIQDNQQENKNNDKEIERSSDEEIQEECEKMDEEGSEKQEKQVENEEDEDDSEEDEEEEEEEYQYTVERILKKRIRNKKCEYFIKWNGFPSSKNTWEPLFNLQNVKNMVYQFECGISQTGKTPKIPKKLLKGISPMKIERIFGHDIFNGKAQYLVSYTDITEPQWVTKNDIPIGYLKQYQNSLLSGNIKCVITQIKSKEKRSRSNSKDISQNKDDQSSFKLFNQDRQTSNDDNEQGFENKKNKKNQKQNEVDSCENNSDPSSQINQKRKVSKKQKKSQADQNENLSQNQIQDESVYNNKISKKKKLNDENSQTEQKKQINSKDQKYNENQNQSISQQQKLEKQMSNKIQEKKQIDNKIPDNQHEENTLRKGVENIQSQSSMDNHKSRNDQLQDGGIQQMDGSNTFIVKNESNIQDISNYPKEGSFEYNDKVQRVIIRTSEKELEAMIFEVFWKPRADCVQPKSKLVRYDELKIHHPESLIYWLEIMVKNSVKELENDDLIIKDLKDQNVLLKQHIQNILNASQQSQSNHINNMLMSQHQSYQIPNMPNSENIKIDLKHTDDKVISPKLPFQQSQVPIYPGQQMFNHQLLQNNLIPTQLMAVLPQRQMPQNQLYNQNQIISLNNNRTDPIQYGAFKQNQDPFKIKTIQKKQTSNKKNNSDNQLNQSKKAKPIKHESVLEISKPNQITIN